MLHILSGSGALLSVRTESKVKGKRRKMYVHSKRKIIIIKIK